MLPRLLYKILVTLVFKLFAFSSVIAQTEFHDDSLKIVDNANKILAVEIDIENQEEIIDFLGQGVVRQNDLAKDLIQRSEERRVGKECRYRCSAKIIKKNNPVVKLKTSYIGVHLSMNCSVKKA